MKIAKLTRAGGKRKAFAKAERYTFKLTIFTGNDEWWEMINGLAAVKERRKEVMAEVVRALFEHGFYFDENYHIAVSLK